MFNGKGLILILAITLLQVSAPAQVACHQLFWPLQTVTIKGALVVQATSTEYKGAITFSSASLEKALDINVQNLVNPFGALGYAGPLGPMGPINKWGPVGDGLHNPTSLISSYEWNNLSNYMKDVGGPLSQNGVYGSFSAVSTSGKNLNKLLFGSKYLEQGSPLMILGTDGVLGPYGLLSALGPNGAHGFKRDAKTCVYQCTTADKTVETRTEIAVATEKENKLEDLVELYNVQASEKLSASRQVLNGRFAIDGKTRSGEATDYNYQAKAGEFINFLVSPSGFGDSFSVQILDKSGAVLASSKSRTLVNFIIFKFEADAQVTIRVTNEGRSPYYNPALETMSALAAMNPFLAGLHKLPKSPLLQTSEYRLHVITSPVSVDPATITGAYWTQFQ